MKRTLSATLLLVLTLAACHPVKDPLPSKTVPKVVLVAPKPKGTPVGVKPFKSYLRAKDPVKNGGPKQRSTHAP